MTFRRLICALIALAFALPLLARADAAQDFFSAAQQDNSSTILTQLLRGFDPNTLNATGETALLIAVRHGSFKAISALLADPQTNVEMRNQQDESPLMLAALKGYLDLAKQLIAGTPTSTSQVGPLCITPPPKAISP
jgi:ankyrin repeat protein